MSGPQPPHPGPYGLPLFGRTPPYPGPPPAPPASQPEDGTRTAQRVLLGVALCLWLLVAGVELVNIPNEWFGVWLVPPFEAALWAVTIGTTVVFLARSKRVPRVTALSVAVVGTLALVHFTNWSVYEPRSYYLTHRWAFEQVAHLADEGSLDSDEYYGEPLPFLLADLSTDGNAAILGHQDGKPVVFLPQFLGIPDGAVGYVYFDGQPDDNLWIDLYGDPYWLTEALPLGDGWWYTR